MDGQGSYYHVEKGKRKRYIACNNPEAGEEDFDSAVKRLKEEAGRRAEEMNLLLKRNEEEEKTEETGGDRRCPSFPDGAEMGAEVG